MPENDVTEPAMKTGVITCSVLETEVDQFARELPQIAYIEKLEQGLHDNPDKLRGTLQAAITRMETGHSEIDTIVLVYGLCSRGTEGIRSQRCKLVIPRAHDCITLLLGSRDRYDAYIGEHPGTYWYSPGWNRHALPPGRQRYEKLYADYIERYGEDNAAYLMQAEQNWFNEYNRATYVHLGIGVTQEDIEFTRKCAAWLKWTFDLQAGEPKLLHDLLAGPWHDDRFVLLEPGRTFRFTADERIIEIDDE